LSRALRRTFLAVAALIVLLAVTGPWFAFPVLGRFLVRSESPKPADAALVLAGDGSGMRILEAGKLVRAGLVSKVYVSGPDFFYGAHESDIAIPFAVRNGYPESAFVGLPIHAFSTREEAEAVLPILRQHGVRTLDLVTSTYHTRRAGWLFRKMAPDMRITVVAAPDPFFTPEGWWREREGRKRFLLEWAKTASDSVGGL
jgi:uncharacterized SAM-binding protein YcdF (DUF218 family)